MLDICIIGAGASGLAAAVTAAGKQKNNSVMIIEKKDVPGRKLAATGNGKCNLTNIHCTDVNDTLLFFEELGVYTRTDGEGRVYPYCSQAKDVVYALVNAAESAGVEIRTDCTVEKIEKKDNCFRIKTNKESITAKKILIATGGKAAPQFGTSGDGYAIAKSFGHTVARLAPVLTGIEVHEDLKMLKGVRVKALVKLLKDGSVIQEEAGEVQFNEDGISGICVMNLSRFIKLEDGEAFAEGIRRYSAEIDFLPEVGHEQLENMLIKRMQLDLGSPENLLISILPQQLRRYIFDTLNVASAQKIDLCKLTEAVKCFRLGITGTKGWKVAQCTAGGVKLDEINMDTMESRIVDDLYFAGEVIDYDGPCGGYNLQNAWITGIKAGKAMADVL